MRGRESKERTKMHHVWILGTYSICHHGFLFSAL